jgi:ribose transport system ATP-binding protein
MGKELLQVSNLVKTYGDFRALDDVSLSIRAGEVHALLGENGAGKSTLVKSIIGDVRPDSGTVAGPVGRDRCIAMVYQELSVIEALSIRENVALGLRRRFGSPFAVGRGVGAAVREVLGRANLGSIDVDAPASSLSLGQRQLLEIAKALAAEAEVLILDEPTATLSDAEITLVHEVVRQIVADGRAVVYITHRLGEVFALADRITVMRSGRVVAEGRVGDFSMDALVTAMLGHEVQEVRPVSAGVASDASASAVHLRGLGSAGRFADVDLTVAGGTIVALFGQLGSGADHIARAVAGMDPAERGEVTVMGRTLGRPDRISAARHRIGFVSADRAREGVFLDASSAVNISSGVLPAISRVGVLSRRRERLLAERIAVAVDLPAEKIFAPAGSLSGGNQQKVAIGRALATEPEVLVLDEPTRGVDVGARGELYRSLRELADRGAAVVVYTSDLEEIRELADVVVTVFRGALIAEHKVDEVTDDTLLKEILHGDAR